MNICQPNNYTSSKRLGIISRRFVLLFGFFILVYSQGLAANTLFIISKQKSLLDNSKTAVFNFTGIDFILIDEDSTATNDSSYRENDSISTSSLLNQYDSLVEDGVDFTEEADSLEPKWSAIAVINYKNQQQQNGVDLSSGKPIIGNSLDISHEIGLALSLGSSHRFDDGLKYQNLSYGLIYKYSAADWVDLLIDYTRYHYASDTINALSAQTGSLSFTADFYIKTLILDLSLDRYFGSDKQTYLSLSGLMPLRYKNLTITPMISISAVSYEIAKKRVNVNKTNQATTKNTISLSSINATVSLRYPLFGGISATFIPSFIYSPIAALASKRSQLNLSIGISYYIDF